MYWKFLCPKYVGKKFRITKNWQVKKEIGGLRKFFLSKDIWSKIFLLKENVDESFGPNRFCVKNKFLCKLFKNVGRKNFWSQKKWGDFFCSWKFFGSKTIFGLKKLVLSGIRDAECHGTFKHSPDALQTSSKHPPNNSRHDVRHQSYHGHYGHSPVCTCALSVKFEFSSLVDGWVGAGPVIIAPLCGYNLQDCKVLSIAEILKLGQSVARKQLP